MAPRLWKRLERLRENSDRMCGGSYQCAVSLAHLVSKERHASAGPLRELGMYPSRLGPGRLLFSSCWEMSNGLWPDNCSESSAKRLMLWRGLSCPEVFYVFFKTKNVWVCPMWVFPKHEQIGKGTVLDPVQANFWRAEGTPTGELTTRFLEAERDEFNSPVREVCLPTSRDPKK